MVLLLILFFHDFSSDSHTQAETSFAELSQEEQRKRSQEWAMLLAMAAMPAIDTALHGKSGTIYGNNVYDNLESQGTQGIYKGSTTSWKPPVDTVGGDIRGSYFRNVKDINDFKSRVPSNASEVPWKNVEGGAAEGVKYRWTDADGNVWNVRAHSIDPNAPIGSNASKGWIYRVEVRWGGKGKKYFMDSYGNFHPENVTRPNSSMYNESIANDTHIMLGD